MKDEPNRRAPYIFRRRPVKLDEDKVRKIKQALAEGMSVRELALRYGVNASTIRDIRSEATWSWVR